MESVSESSRPAPARPVTEGWFQRFSPPILFLIISLTLIGGYLAFSIPVSVFPSVGSLMSNMNLFECQGT